MVKCSRSIFGPGQSRDMVMSMQTLSCRWEKQLGSSLEEDSWNNRCYCPNPCPWGRSWPKEKKGRFSEWEINIASIIRVQKEKMNRKQPNKNRKILTLWSWEKAKGEIRSFGHIIGSTQIWTFGQEGIYIGLGENESRKVEYTKVKNIDSFHQCYQNKNTPEV